MTDFWLAFAAFALSTVVPASVVILLVGRSRSKVEYAVAFSIGVFLLYFSDTFAGSAYLNLSQGVGLDQFPGELEMLALFVIGLLTFSWIDGGRLSTQDLGPKNISVPFLVAFAMGLHGAGEGLGFSLTAFSAAQSSFLAAIGGLASGASFVLHKILEAIVVASVYSAFTSRSGSDSSRSGQAALVGFFVGPGILGMVLGYYVQFDASPIFALATGASAYVLLRLIVEILPASSGKIPFPRYALAIAAGFVATYAAALLHS